MGCYSEGKVTVFSARSCVLVVVLYQLVVSAVFIACLKGCDILYVPVHSSTRSVCKMFRPCRTDPNESLPVIYQQWALLTTTVATLRRRGEPTGVSEIQTIAPMDAVNYYIQYSSTTNTHVVLRSRLQSGTCPYVYG